MVDLLVLVVVLLLLLHVLRGGTFDVNTLITIIIVFVLIAILFRLVPMLGLR